MKQKLSKQKWILFLSLLLIWIMTIAGCVDKNDENTQSSGSVQEEQAGSITLSSEITQ